MTDSRVDKQLKSAREDLKSAYRRQAEPETITDLEKRLKLALFQKGLVKAKHRD